MRYKRHTSLFFVAAIVCFVIALLITTGVVDSVRYNAWLTGGFLSLSLGLGGAHA
jgi:hypothetical protein